MKTTFQNLCYLCSKSHHMRNVILIFGLIILSTSLYPQKQQEVPYTLADRDRLIRVEARMEALDAKMEALDAKMGALESNVEVRFETQQTQINDLKTMFFWGFGILITLNIFILGFIIWDRRTAMKPAMDKASSASEKTRNLIVVLREYAKKNPDLAEIMKMHGFL